MRLFEELKRRNVVRVGIAYVVLGWVVVQIAQLLFESFGTPDWVIKTVIVLVALGFPFALLFAWAFELTPDGLRKTRDVDIAASVTATTGRKLDFVIIGALVIALGYFVWERQAHVHLAPGEEDVAAAGKDAVPDGPAEEVSTPAQKRSIAVLPFVSMATDEEQDFFADGLTEEILNSLAKTPDLLVAARTSSFGYKGTEKPVQVIAEELGVSHVLEGSVRRGGDRLRITAQLIRASDGFHVFSETFDRRAEDVIAVQEEIAVQIARALETTMDPEALKEMMQSGTSSVAAYNAYLTATGAVGAAFQTGDRYVLLEAVDAFEEAVRLDPEFAEAWWRLSGFWYLQSQSNQIFTGVTELSAEEIEQKLDETFEKAILHEDDEISKLRYLAAQAEANLDYQRAAELSRRYFEERPNADDEFGALLNRLRVLGLRDEIADRIGERYDTMPMTRGNANAYAQALRSPEEHGDLMRRIANEAVNRFGGNVGVMYQVHRLMLWADDIDGAARLVPSLRNSNLDEENRLLVQLRQDCAEGRTADALAVYGDLVARFGDDLVIAWLAHSIIGDQEAAAALFDPYDEAGDVATLQSYLPYSNFDPTRYPNLMRALRGQGIEDRDVIPPPYSCNLPDAADSA